MSIAAVASLPPVGPAVVNVSKSNLSAHTSKNIKEKKLIKLTNTNEKNKKIYKYLKNI